MEYTEEYAAENEDYDEDEDYEEEVEETEDAFTRDRNKKMAMKKESSPILSKFEYATLLGTRIKQLDEGARPCLTKEELQHLHDHRSIAEKEIYLRKIPLMIQREMPDGTIEEWKLSEFQQFPFDA
jgi:DNA-directed RNA polymerase subunit K/omega